VVGERDYRGGLSDVYRVKWDWECAHCLLSEPRGRDLGGGSANTTIGAMLSVSDLFAAEAGGGGGKHL